MVSAGVCWKGKTSIHFIDTEKTKVNSVNYMKLLDDGLLLQSVEICTPGEDYMYIFQQDGAIARTSNVIQEHIDEEVPEFIKKDEWPPQSPDCNPMDYHVHVGLTLREGLSGPH
jgi:hypothetical protein